MMSHVGKSRKLKPELKSMEFSKSLCDVNFAQSKYHHVRRKSSELGPDPMNKTVTGESSNNSDQQARRAQQNTLSSEFFRYDLRGEFPEFFVRKAERELGETSENREKALRELKELIRKNGEDFKTDDFFLLMFLRVKKFEPERVFRHLRNFYEFKRKVHDECKPIDVPLLRQELSKKVYTLLPYRDHLGRGIYITRMRVYDPDLCPINEMININAVSILALLDDPINQVAGFVVVMDFRDISLGWLAHFGIQRTKYQLFLYFNALPIRYQEVHFVNENFLFKPVFRAIQMLSTKKIKERIFFHGRNLQALHKHIPPALLPPEYGGTMLEEEIILDAADIVANRALN